MGVRRYAAGDAPDRAPQAAHAPTAHYDHVYTDILSERDYLGIRFPRPQVGLRDDCALPGPRLSRVASTGGFRRPEH